MLLQDRFSEAGNFELLLTLFPTVPNIKEGDIGRISIDIDSEEFIIHMYN